MTKEHTDGPHGHGLSDALDAIEQRTQNPVLTWRLRSAELAAFSGVAFRERNFAELDRLNNQVFELISEILNHLEQNPLEPRGTYLPGAGGISGPG